jgi:tetratricopeptide (TPR) repeat protein
MNISRSFFAGCALAAFVCAGQVGCAGQPTTPEEQPAPPEEQQPRAEERAVEPGEQLGEVDFETSCNEQAQADFERGLLRLHHMWYVKARESFEEATAADDECAMAHWGVAMTYYTPLWVAPEAEDLEAGSKAAQRAAELVAEMEAPTQRERDFIAAVEAFYDDYEQREHAEGAAAFRDAWERAYQRNPEDIEAASFYALSMLSTVPAITEDFETHKRAGAILEDVLRQEPMHPGGHHYLLHAYDNPELAEQAVPVARRYAEIAPSVPHALHMPSHIFTRLGLWQDNAEWNLRSAEVAADNPVDGKTSLHFYHALDYVVYAYLQQAMDQDAEQVVERARQADDPQQHLAVGYAAVAIPARMALEQRDWQKAADVEPLHQDALAFEKWPFLVAITHATRAIGSVYEGDVESARQEVSRIEELQAESADMQEPYWVTQMEIYHDVADALVDYAEDRPEAALTKLRQAVSMQDALQKHPVSPGRVIEAADYLGEVLRQEELPQEALQVYERALEVTPNRFHAVHGAAISAREAGQDQVAGEYYTQLLELARGGDDARPELQEARQYLDAQQVARSKDTR